MRACLLAAIAGVLALVAPSALATPCSGFTDVDASASYCAAVDFIKNKGITAGCTATTYCPDQYVTRSQMALFMQRFARGGPNNSMPGPTDAIGGGDANFVARDSNASIGGGYGNSASGSHAAIGGGIQNTAAGYANAVGGGYMNQASSERTVIGGGEANQATDWYATVGGGRQNVASNEYATVSGGWNNVASGIYSTVAGGLYNTASGWFSFAAGYRAKATTLGSFIWADDNPFDFQPSVNNFFGVRATGGVGLTVAINDSGAPAQFCNLLPGTPSWQCTSDRNAKENLAEADGAAVLAGLAAMPVYTYSMKGSDASVRSMGPTAQDFRAAFGLGNDDRTIASINLEGVALAAIKELKSELDGARAAFESQRADNDALQRRNDDLARRLEAIERILAR